MHQLVNDIQSTTFFFIFLVEQLNVKIVFCKLTTVFRNSEINYLRCSIRHKNYLRKHKIKS
jgi:hypothetical protein